MVTLNLASCAASIIESERVRCPDEPAAVQHYAQRYADADRNLQEFVRRLHPSFSDRYGDLPEKLTAASFSTMPNNTHCILYQA